MHNTILWQIITYMKKNRGLFPIQHIPLLSMLEEMQIVTVKKGKGELDNTHVEAELSVNHARGYEYYLGITTGNNFRRWLKRITLTNGQAKCLEILRRDCEKIEEIKTGKKFITVVTPAEKARIDALEWSV